MTVTQLWNGSVPPSGIHGTVAKDKGPATPQECPLVRHQPLTEIGQDCLRAESVAMDARPDLRADSALLPSVALTKAVVFLPYRHTASPPVPAADYAPA